MHSKRPQRITIEEGIERASGSYIATVTHEGKRHRQHGLKTLDAARAWRTAKKADLLPASEAGTPARSSNLTPRRKGTQPERKLAA